MDALPTLFFAPVHIVSTSANNNRVSELKLQTFSLFPAAGVANVVFGSTAGVATVAGSCVLLCVGFFRLHGGLGSVSFWFVDVDSGFTNTPKLRRLFPHTQLRVLVAQHALHGLQHRLCLHLSWQGRPQPLQISAAFEQNFLHTPHFLTPLSIVIVCVRTGEVSKWPARHANLFGAGVQVCWVVLCASKTCIRTIIHSKSTNLVLAVLC